MSQSLIIILSIVIPGIMIGIPEITVLKGMPYLSRKEFNSRYPARAWVTVIYPPAFILIMAFLFLIYKLTIINVEPKSNIDWFVCPAFLIFCSPIVTALFELITGVSAHGPSKSNMGQYKMHSNAKKAALVRILISLIGWVVYFSRIHLKH